MKPSAPWNLLKPNDTNEIIMYLTAEFYLGYGFDDTQGI